MRYQLLDYQRDAAIEVLTRLDRARTDWHGPHASRASFALSAITGSGKTVIATAVIEALLFGSSALGPSADPRAAFLWVTDDPALNRQTMEKMWAASDQLTPFHTLEIDSSFNESSLAAGRVYFLNIQKLSKTADLTQRSNTRQHTMWDVLANTIRGGAVDLYLVLDEAHRGMKTASDRTTIVRRIIDGESGSNPPVPAVWGISATIARFSAAMEGSANRTTYPAVEVDVERVRESGLVKDEIVLDEPDESGTFSTTLLREAVRSTLDFEQRWANYSTTQGEPTVLPVMVVQVPDKSSDAHLAEMVATIEGEWPSLPRDAIAHVFGEHQSFQVGGRIVPWAPPESIEKDHRVRVVLAKEAISTGWDCPRAEVLYSERPAKDVTHIAQIIGRMVRQPLAHRIATDDALNAVTCFLPRFERTALGAIKAELEGSPDVRVAATVVRAGKVFDVNPNIPADVFTLISELPSLPAPDVLASPLSRAKELARLLTDTLHSPSRGTALLPRAGEALTTALVAQLDGLAVQHAALVADNIRDFEETAVRRSRVAADGTGAATVVSRSIRTQDRDLIRDTSKVIKSVKEGVGTDYLKHRDAKGGTDPITIRTEVAALLRVDDVREEVDEAATKWVQTQLTRFKVDIGNTTGATRDAYRRVQERTAKPEVVGVDLRANTVASTKDAATGSDLPTFGGHLYSDEHGMFPAKFNDWETQVIAIETARPTFVAWFRNPSRATPAALRIAYQQDSGAWTSVQPDFLLVSRRDDGTLGVSIVDPHGDFFADARPKLLALADYAERFGNDYVRIDSISEVGSELRVLDLQSPAVRTAVRAFTGTQIAALYESSTATTFL